MAGVKIIRIDPIKRTIASMVLRSVRDATPQLRSIIRAKKLGQHELMKVDGTPLLAIGGLDVDEEMQGWRLRGTDDHAGIGVLVGHTPRHNTLSRVPVTAEWVRDRIVWLDGEDVEGRDQRADEVVDLLDAQMREVIATAVVIPSGDIWLQALDRDRFGAAMIRLGLGTDVSGGQRLTKLGEAVHDKLVFGASLATADAQ